MKKSAQQPIPSDTYHNQLVVLSAAFDTPYDELLRRTRAALGQKGRPLIVILDDKATLLHDGGTETAVITSPLYQRLTILNHIAPGVLLTLAANGPGPLHPPTRAHLERQLGLITNALSSLDEQRPPGQHHQHQQQTLEQAQALINVILISGQIEASRLDAYEAANADLQQENALLSAALLLDTLRTITDLWRKELDTAAWGQLCVIIAAASTARHLEVARVYFQHLLQQPPGNPADPETRLIYHANIATVDQALDLLAQPLIDQRAPGLGNRGLQTQGSQIANAAQEIISLNGS